MIPLPFTLLLWICSLCMIFVNLINICLEVFCLGFILFGTLWFSWTWVTISCPILGMFSTVISSRQILIKLTKIKHKEQILKAAREKQQIIHKRIPIRITADLSIETLQARREWQDILKAMKEKNLQPWLLYPARISFKYEGEIKSFTDKQKLREFSTTKPAHQQILKDLL